ncbi:hypothetical protein GIW81_00050 [Hyphomicrobium sp. xq]|uniref:Porin n=2 Tax=Hyphomicrobium album TaxID=2665159 RepID=A0A6I3KD35_9HYPH|nr:hypothetical protein [Hyphomicrobium album]
MLAQAATQAASGTEKTDNPKVSDKKPTSPNATASLVNALVEKGVLTEEQATAIIQQADDETYVGREAAKDATVQAAEAAKAAKEAALAASPPGTKHVSYVPETVKRQLRDDIRAEVMDQAKRENWASPGKYPEWASHMKFYGDIRARYEGIFFPDGNAPGGFFPNFNSINTGSPYDIRGGATNPYPRYNTDQDRTRFRTRVRLGLNADLGEGFTAGLRMASGNDGSPVSPNQTFGSSGGYFSKYSIWLDRAFIKYAPIEEAKLSIGRFDNPFFAPADLVWDPDLGFDGVALQAKHEIMQDLVPWAVAGAFPIFNTDLNFASNEDNKYDSEDKYLYGAQVGVAWKPRENIGLKFGVAYYDFDNVKGKVSSECEVINSSSACDTDALRPSFAQRGNTYTPLRNIQANASNGNGTTNQFQYFGLASDFKELVVTAQADLGYFSPYHIIIDGEYVQNLAFDRSAIVGQGAVNNIGASFNGAPGTYDGGGYGWFVRTTVGHTELEEFGDWNTHLGYKWLESDATLDAFTDSDFGLGGTNLKGFIVGGNLALSHSVTTTVKGFSANAIAGAPYSVDILQLDVNAKF